MDGIAVGRRCGEHAKVASTHQRELQGARDGRGSKGKGIDIDLELTKLLLGGNAKLLLFVDDKKA